MTAAGAINLLPMSGGESRSGVAIEGRDTQPGDPPTRMHPRIVTPGYFEAMAIPIAKGRAFTSQDDDHAQPVVVVNEAAAIRYWPNQDPVGRRMRFGGEDTWQTVIGIASDVRHWGLTREINPMVYRAQAQQKSQFLTFVLKTTVDPGSLSGLARAAVASVDPTAPVSDLRTMDQVVDASLRSTRAQVILMSAFGALALLLALVGIYGVTSQLVGARVREIGVRMALGAKPVDVLRQLLGEGLWQTAAGLLVGAVAGVLLMSTTSVGAAMLYQVKAWDPLTMGAIAALLIVTALVAHVIPARRAMRVDPVDALR